MSCGKNLKNCNYKSNQTVFNNTEQPFTSTVTTLMLLGDIACDTGCSITTNENSFTINNTGLYRISADITYKTTADGEVTFGIYNNGVLLPCAYSKQSAYDRGVESTHVETTLYLQKCRNYTLTITLGINGIEGTVTHLSSTMTKLA